MRRSKGVCPNPHPKFIHLYIDSIQKKPIVSLAEIVLARNKGRELRACQNRYSHQGANIQPRTFSLTERQLLRFPQFETGVQVRELRLASKEVQDGISLK